jgi:hypothetical protein
MKIKKDNCPFKISEQFVSIIEDEIEKSGIINSVILNFRDPDYSPESGGWHPVEIFISLDGTIQYITDFAYVGSPSDTELVKEIDFDFAAKRFGHMGRDLPIGDGVELFHIFQSNFCSFYESGVYQVHSIPIVEVMTCDLPN